MLRRHTITGAGFNKDNVINMTNIFHFKPKNVVYRFREGCVTLDLYTEPKTNDLTVFVQDKEESDKYMIKRFEIKEKFLERDGKIDSGIDVIDFSQHYGNKLFDEEGVNKKIVSMKNARKKIGGMNAVKIFGTIGIAYVNDTDIADDDILKNIGLAYMGILDTLKTLTN